MFGQYQVCMVVGTDVSVPKNQIIPPPLLQPYASKYLCTGHYASILTAQSCVSAILGGQQEHPKCAGVRI